MSIAGKWEMSNAMSYAKGKAIHTVVLLYPTPIMRKMGNIKQTVFFLLIRA